MSEMKEITGHLLSIGDRVRMNISVIGEGDLDGVEITATQKNYWRYMNQHPDEVYTIVAYNFSNDDEVSYVLSGYMSDNNWYADELILVPEPKTRFEAIKSMTDDELARFLGPAFNKSVDDMLNWLKGDYESQEFAHCFSK